MDLTIEICFKNKKTQLAIFNESQSIILNSGRFDCCSYVHISSINNYSRCLKRKRQHSAFVRSSPPDTNAHTQRIEYRRRNLVKTHSRGRWSLSIPIRDYLLFIQLEFYFFFFGFFLLLFLCEYRHFNNQPKNF